MTAVKTGKNFVNVQPNGVYQVVAPATNTGGIVLSSALIISGLGTANVTAGTRAPTASTDNGVPVIFAANNVSSTIATSAAMPYPLYIPAGQGLWIATNNAGASVSLTWDLVA